MKTLTLLCLFFSLSLFADFAKRKAEALKGVDKRIQTLQNLKSCISGAEDKAGIKNCRAERKKAMQEMKKMRIDAQVEKLEKRKQKLLEKKGK